METCLKTHDYILRSVLNLKYDLERNRNHSLIRSISGRLKTMDSLSAKLQRLGYEVTVKDAAEVLHDIVGIRIVCSYLNDIYSAIERLQTLDRIQITEIKDYVAHPKPSGYRSVHVIGLCDITGENIQFEIQLRTTAMDSGQRSNTRCAIRRIFPKAPSSTVNFTNARRCFLKRTAACRRFTAICTTGVPRKISKWKRRLKTRKPKRKS